MSKMLTLENEIHSLLIRYPETRDSNEKLYAYYLMSHRTEFNVPDVIDFFLGFKKYKVSSFESVTRCRRKIVEKHPELGASPAVQEKRQEQQFDIWDYAKGRDF